MKKTNIQRILLAILTLVTIFTLITGSAVSVSAAETTTASSSTEAAASKADTAAAKKKVKISDPKEIAHYIIGLQATVETDYDACFIYIETAKNPYDAEWDFGKNYEVFVRKSNWDLVFDAEYYKKTFPALAMQYHDDDELLLRHFQTVGIHEGRQGCESFNVAAYKDNVKKSIVDLFGDNYECYYFYYMLNSASQTKVKSTGDYPKQLTVRLTALQQLEFDHINEYRAEVGLKPYIYDSELAAATSYRCYVDLVGKYSHHDWVNDPVNSIKVNKLLNNLSASSISENTIHYVENVPETMNTMYELFYDSKPHREAMLDKSSKYYGGSNIFVTSDPYTHPDTDRKYSGVLYDMFTGKLSTPLNH